MALVLLVLYGELWLLATVLVAVVLIVYLVGPVWHFDNLLGEADVLFLHLIFVW